MTMWPDQPPLSRRQVRQKKREEAGESASDLEEIIEPEIESRMLSTRTGRRVRWDPSAANPVPLAASSRSDEPASGEAGPGSGELTAHEVGADEVGADEVSADEVGADSGSADEVSADDDSVAETSAEVDSEVHVNDDTSAGGRAEADSTEAPFRMRNYDFSGSPGGLGSNSDIESSLAGLARQNPEPMTDADVAGLSTEAFPMTTEIYVNDRTITRRELRAMRAQAEAAGEPVPLVVFQRPGSNAPDSAVEPRADDAGVVDEVPVEEVPVDEVPVHDVPVDEAPVDEAETTAEIVPGKDDAGDDDAIDDDAVVGAAVDGAADDEPEIEVPEGQVPEADVAGVVEESPADSVDLEPDAVPDDPTDARLDADRLDDVSDDAPDGELNATPVDEGEAIDDHHDFVEAELVEPEELIEPPDPAVARENASERDADGSHEAEQTTDDADAPSTGPMSVGHWSAPADDDANELNDSTLSRDIGLTTGVIGTHALVLPSVPDANEQLMTPISSTGEIIVTGIVELPRSFGETGAHPALFDHSDVDALIDEADREDAASGSAPVRASRAVASNISSRGVIEAPAPRRGRWPLVVGIIVVAAVFIGITAGLIYAFSTGII